MAHDSHPPSNAEGKIGGKAANDDDHKHGDDLEGLHGHDHGPTDGPWWKSPKARLTLLCAAAFGAAFLLAKLVPQSAPWGYVAAMMVGLTATSLVPGMCSRFAVLCVRVSSSSCCTAVSWV